MLIKAHQASNFVDFRQLLPADSVTPPQMTDEPNVVACPHWPLSSNIKAEEAKIRLNREPPRHARTETRTMNEAKATR
jgi:hypothetical protein